MDPVHQAFLAKLSSWATSQSEIRGILLVGSFARGASKPDSDIDLLIIAKNPGFYLSTLEWTHELGEISRHQIEEWGKLTSLRVWFQYGLEIEFGFAAESWIATPLDPGTRKVLLAGYQILNERNGLLSNAINEQIQ